MWPLQEGLKHLLNALASDATAAALDAATAALPPDGAVPAASWPGLAHVLARTAGEEVKGLAGRKKGPDPQLHRAFRAMVARAEESERRCGHRHMLRRRAASLFRHISEVLEAVGLSSAMGADYSAALRTHLLGVPEYCACSSAHTFQGEHCCRGEGAGAGAAAGGTGLGPCRAKAAVSLLALLDLINISGVFPSGNRLPLLGFCGGTANGACRVRNATLPRCMPSCQMPKPATAWAPAQPS